MSDVRKLFECSYCGAKYHIKYPEDLEPLFCAFCAEQFEEPEEVIEEEEDDGDLDYSDDERDLDKYN
jgi:hypothetical protein